MLGVLPLVILIGFGGMVGYEQIAARSAANAATEVEERSMLIHAQIAQWGREVRHDSQSEDLLRLSLLALAQAPSAPAAAQTPVARPPQAFDINQMIAERPELKALYDANAKAAEMELYGWLIVSLSPEAAERFRSERLQHDRQLSEIGKASREHGWNREAPERVALRLAEVERHAREMAAILDAAQMQQYQDYEKSLRPRNYVAGELARQLYYTANPLSPVQAQAITELVTRHGSDPRGRFDFDAVNWDVLIREARAHLTDPQFERLANLSEMRRLQTQVIAIERAFGARADGK